MGSKRVSMAVDTPGISEAECWQFTDGSDSLSRAFPNAEKIGNWLLAAEREATRGHLKSRFLSGEAWSLVACI
jgi:hypothetical protein